MNMQAIMRQAQQMQKDMLKAKEEINNSVFTGESSLVKVEVNGKKEVLKVNILSQELEADDLEILGDMVVVALNDAFSKVDKMTKEKMGKFGAGLDGLI